MGIYALINTSGLVVNVIAKDPNTEIPIPDGWELINIDGLPVGIGCIYEGGDFTCPE
ncbi:hypothetical protein ACX1HG_02820 [Yersinia enterocolitica]|uniref:hypothetical protein n=1 Tax=Yersinia enterocolitica TaxID=630 RepID=UPI001CA47164|nr:hypothetical protein [Yersinia enterocolitica]MBW5861886.1 hypothetical protein [Yersinia enterocolitica]